MTEEHKRLRKLLLNWYHGAKHGDRLDDFGFTRWKDRVGADTLLAAIKIASEEQLADLYIYREETRLGI